MEIDRKRIERKLRDMTVESEESKNNYIRALKMLEGVNFTGHGGIFDRAKIDGKNDPHSRHQKK